MIGIDHGDVIEGITVIEDQNVDQTRVEEVDHVVDQGVIREGFMRGQFHPIIEVVIEVMIVQ